MTRAAHYTLQLMDELRARGGATVLLDELDEVARYHLDTDQEFHDRKVARARQRLYLAARYAGLKVTTTSHTNRVVGIVEEVTGE